MAEAYITQSYSWNTGDTITAARLNGNVTNLISGLQDGDKAVNLLKVLGAGQQFMTADGSDITLQNVDTYSGKDTITIHKAENDGNPSILLGAGTAERLEVNAVFDSGAQTLDYVEFKTKAASATADKGQIKFLVDEAAIFNVVDGGISILAGKDLLMSSTSDITVNTNKFTVAGATGNTVIAGTLDVTGAIGSTASITLGAGADLIGSSTSDITFNTNKFTVAGATGNTVIAGTLDVTGAIGSTASITLGAGADLIGSSTSDITFNTNKFTVAGATGNTAIAGTLGITGDVAINTNKFNITAASGNTTIAGTLGVTGAITGPTATDTINGVVINSSSVSSVTTLSLSGAISGATATDTINGIVINSSAISSVTTLGLSGAITGATATNTINGLVINSGALSSITTLTMSGNLTVDTNTLFVDASGNKVGIGTASPDDELDVENLTANCRIRIKGAISDTTLTNGNSGAALSLFQNDTTNGNYNNIINFDGNGNANSFLSFQNIDHTNKGAMHFITRNASGFGNRMTIDEDGNVGIGTTGPGRKLDVLDASNPQARFSYDGSNYSEISIDSAGTMVVAPTGGLFRASGVISSNGAGGLTIASGAVNISTAAIGNKRSLIVLSPEGGVADDLDTVTPVSSVAGQFLILKTDGSATITAKDGTGNLVLSGDFAMDSANDTLTLVYDGTNWLEQARSNNA